MPMIYNLISSCIDNQMGTPKIAFMSRCKEVLAQSYTQIINLLNDLCAICTANNFRLHMDLISPMKLRSLWEICCGIIQRVVSPLNWKSSTFAILLLVRDLLWKSFQLQNWFHLSTLAYLISVRAASCY